MAKQSLNISGKRIKQKRLEKNWDQADLSAALTIDHELKLTQSDISEIERGVRSVRDYELNAFAFVLNVDPIWLLRGES